MCCIAPQAEGGAYGLACARNAMQHATKQGLKKCDKVLYNPTQAEGGPMLMDHTALYRTKILNFPFIHKENYSPHLRTLYLTTWKHNCQYLFRKKILSAVLYLPHQIQVLIQIMQSCQTKSQDFTTSKKMRQISFTKSPAASRAAAARIDHSPVLSISSI